MTPNYHYRGRTAPLTSKRCILYIYSTNIGTEYFKHGINSPFFPSSKCSLFHNSNVFGSCIIYILYTGCAKIKKKNNGAKSLNMEESNHKLSSFKVFPNLQTVRHTIFFNVIHLVCANYQMYSCTNIQSHTTRYINRFGQHAKACYKASTNLPF